MIHFPSTTIKIEFEAAPRLTMHWPSVYFCRSVMRLNLPTWYRDKCWKILTFCKKRVLKVFISHKFSIIKKPFQKLLFVDVVHYLFEGVFVNRPNDCLVRPRNNIFSRINHRVFYTFAKISALIPKSAVVFVLNINEISPKVVGGVSVRTTVENESVTWQTKFVKLEYGGWLIPDEQTFKVPSASPHSKMKISSDFLPLLTMLSPFLKCRWTITSTIAANGFYYSLKTEKRLEKFRNIRRFDSTFCW